MATSASRTITVTLTGDVTYTEPFSAAVNTASPAQIEIRRLASGNTTVNVPGPVTGFTAVAVLIIPPAGNATALTFKGIAGDTGVRIHNTDPTVVALDTSVASFVLNAAAQIDGVRLIWL